MPIEFRLPIAKVLVILEKDFSFTSKQPLTVKVSKPKLFKKIKFKKLL